MKRLKPIEFLQRQNLHRQLGAAVSIGIFLLALLTSLVSTWQNRDYLRTDIIKQGQGITELLARQSLLALLYESPENVMETANLTMSMPGVTGLEVYTATGKTLLSLGQPQSHSPMQAQNTSATILQAETDISWLFSAPVYTQAIDDGISPPRPAEYLGMVSITLSKSTYLQAVKQILINNLFTALCFALLFLFLLGLFIRHLTQPLNALAKKMEQAQQGKPDVQARIQGTSDIIHMAKAFNSMMQVLNERENALRIAATAFETEEGMIVTDHDANIIRINKAFSRITGYSPEEAVGHKTNLLRSNYHPPEFYQRMWHQLNRQRYWQGEIWNRYKNGEIHPQLLSITAVHNELGDATHYVGAYIDITERKQTEQALRTSATKLAIGTARLKEAQRIARLGSWEFDIQTGKYTFSDQLLNLFELSKLNFPGTHQGLLSRVHPDDIGSIKQAYVTFLDKKQSYKICYRLKLAKNKIKWMEAQGEVEQQANGERYISREVIQDITEQKETQLALIQAKQAAELASQVKSEFLANMSHEIRTPMNAILGLTQLVLESGLPTHQEDFLKKAYASAQALLRILNDILDYSKIEAGKLSIEHIDFDAESILHQIYDLYGAAIEEKKLDLYFDIAPDVPTQLNGDPLRLSQILNNLISNAIKFTQQGNILIRIRLIEHTYKDWLLEFSVKDSGIGLEKHQLDLLFKPFNQADTSTTRQYGGTGLGLSICQRLVELMDGSIQAESTAGHGCTFSFTARLGKVINAAPPYSSYLPINQPLLLIAPPGYTLEICQRLLQYWQLPLQTATTPKQATSQLHASNNERLLILDWNMPEKMRIIQMLKDSHKHNSTALILIIRPYDRNAAYQATRGLPIAAILTQPFTPSQLYAILTNPGAKNILNIPPQACDALSSNKLNSRHILLVEDNKINALMAGEMLSRRGARVTHAHDGLHALQMVEQQHFDLILMDLHMPVMDGLAATRRIRQLPTKKHLPIIAMTAAVLQEDMQRCEQAGMNDFIGKPIDTTHALEILQKWLPEAPSSPTLPSNPTATTTGKQALPDTLPGLELQDALQRLDGNHELLHTLLLNFAEENHNLIEQLNSLCGSKDQQQLVLRLHTLKGTASNLGATQLSKLANQCEHQVKQHIPDTMPAALTQMLSVVLHSIASLKTTPPAPDHDEMTTLDHALLQQLQPYLAQHDLIPQSLTDQLRQQHANHPQIQQLLHQLYEFDYDTAAETLSQLLANSEQSSDTPVTPEKDQTIG